mmetsp:Transcript_5876/g.13586  ORF Transcript_5876/g.13586 Transcript_5876/m.13586 type:complete len:251 (+) Transcript_5876:35-787(+)
MKKSSIKTANDLHDPHQRYPMQWMLHRGFDMYDVNSIRGRRDDTPMHQACREGELRVVKFLFKSGARLSDRDLDGNTPMHFACRGGHVHVQRWLEAHGAAVDAAAKNHLGITPVGFLFDGKQLDGEAELGLDQQAQVHEDQRAASAGGKRPTGRRPQSAPNARGASRRPLIRGGPGLNVGLRAAYPRRATAKRETSWATPGPLPAPGPNQGSFDTAKPFPSASPCTPGGSHGYPEISRLPLIHPNPRCHS